MALVAGPFLGGRNGGGARNLRLLALPLLGGEIDRLVAFGAFAREIAGDFGNLGFTRLVDQRDLAVAALLLQRQFLLHLRDFAALRLGGESDIALGAQLLQRLFVLKFALLDRQALIEHKGLLLAQLLGLLVGDFLVLAGARNRFLALDFQQFELRGEILVADRDRGLLLGGVDLAPRLRGDLGDDLETFGVEHVVGPEILLGRLFQRDDRHFFEHQAVGGEAFADVFLYFAWRRRRGSRATA